MQVSKCNYFVCTHSHQSNTAVKA